MKSYIILLIQRLLLFSFYYFFKTIKVAKKNKERYFCIGTFEIAKIIYTFSKVLPDSYTVNFGQHKFYPDFKYDFTSYGYLKYIMGPIYLAFLANACNNFIYIWNQGFLYNIEHDFRFLKARGIKVIVYFCGDDIRSLKKSKDFFNSIGYDSANNYYEEIDKTFKAAAYDLGKAKLAQITDKYADLVFNSFEQFSYLTIKTYPFTYFIDKDLFKEDHAKFDFGNKIRIVHAPSSPILKGTQLVRAALKKLEIENYQFEYIELTGKPNSIVLEELQKSHIVLNQFYMIAPGVFGIEAMLSANAVLMAADPDLNPDLKPEMKGAFVVTHYWEIYDKLKWLLDNPQLIKQYALQGRKFVEENYTYEKAREYFEKIFVENNIPIK